MHLGGRVPDRGRAPLHQARPAAGPLHRGEAERNRARAHASLAEEADYEPAQARLAGIQRLLVDAGYDANPIDGLEGKKTEAALSQFLKERRLAPEAATAEGFFDTLVASLKQADGVGFAWCNETTHTVMAAFGIEEKAGTVTRGWYRIEPGRCVKPDVAGKPRRLYSFAEAVDADGQVVRRADKPLAWGGTTPLCTRNVKFEISDHKDCAGKGLTASGFELVRPRRPDRRHRAVPR